MSILVQGPQGCGKSRTAQQIKESLEAEGKTVSLYDYESRFAPIDKNADVFITVEQ